MSPLKKPWEVFDEAVDTYIRHKSNSSLKVIEEFAEFGDPYAQFLMGHHFFINEDYPMALMWLLPASYEGEDRVNAYLEIAPYWNFDGREMTDEELRHEKLQTLSEVSFEHLMTRKGDSEAQFTLGYMYHSGKGVEIDNEKSVFWYKLSAKNGHANSQYNLGRMYQLGDGVQKNYQHAAHYYYLAAEQGNDSAKKNLYVMQYESLPTEIKVNFKDALDNNDPNLHYKIGHWFAFDEKNPNKDYRAALKWFNASSNNDNSNAQYALGYMYQHGIGVNCDINLAKSYYEKSANNGNSKSQFQLGFLYFSDEFPFTDYSNALNWFTLSSDNGYIHAHSNLGYMYEHGLGVDVDHDRAFDLYEKGATAGDATAQYNLAECFEEGRGTDVDVNQAIHWYRESASNGDEDAQEKLDAISRQQQSFTPEDKHKTVMDAVSFAPLTRHGISDATWSKENQLNKSLQNILKILDQITHMEPREKGEHIGNQIIRLQNYAVEFGNDRTVVDNKEWREESSDCYANIDAHIAYNALRHKVGYQVSDTRAVELIHNYIKGDSIQKNFDKGEHDPLLTPHLAVGIDFIEKVVAEIID